MTAGRIISNRQLTPPIELFSAAIVGDGTTDDSTAVKAAHDAAYAQGVRHVYCGRQYYVPSLSAACGNVIFVGEGKLIGNTTRKRIVPYNADRPYRFEAGINPGKHLAVFTASSSKKVAFVGDSIGTRTANNVTGTGAISEEVFNKFTRAYPGATMSFFNFSIPTMGWSNLASASAVPVGVQPSWYNASQSWIAQVLAFNPDVIVFELGTNAGTTTVELPAVYSVMSQIEAWASSNSRSVPDRIICTPFMPSLQNPSWNTAFAQDTREQFASFLRGYALRRGFGLIDTGRMAMMMRDGYDPLRENLKVVQTGFGMTTPYTFPTATRDYYLDFQMNSSTVAVLSASVSLNFQIGSYAGQSILLNKLGSGNFGISLAIPGASPNPLNAVDTGIAVPSGVTLYLEFYVKGNFASIRYSSGTAINAGQGALMWSGYVERLCSLWTPLIYFSNNLVTSMFTSALAVSEGALIMPTLTDVELYGDYQSTNTTYGGSGDVHPGAIGTARLYGAMLDAERLAA